MIGLFEIYSMFLHLLMLLVQSLSMHKAIEIVNVIKVLSYRDK